MDVRPYFQRKKIVRGRCRGVVSLKWNGAFSGANILIIYNTCTTPSLLCILDFKILIRGLKQGEKSVFLRINMFSPFQVLLDSGEQSVRWNIRENYKKQRKRKLRRERNTSKKYDLIFNNGHFPINTFDQMLTLNQSSFHHFMKFDI